MDLSPLYYRQRERERERLRAERQAMRTAEEKKLAHTLPNPEPFTQFETLQAPSVDADISTAQLFSIAKEVPLKQVCAISCLTPSGLID